MFRNERGARVLEETKKRERSTETMKEGQSEPRKKKMNKKRRKGLHCGCLHKRHAKMWQETQLR